MYNDSFVDNERSSETDHEIRTIPVSLKFVHLANTLDPSITYVNTYVQ